MVIALTKSQRVKINHAVTEINRLGKARLTVTIMAAADDYDEFLLPAGLAIGTLIALIARAAWWLPWPWLLVFQPLGMLVVKSLPVLRYSLIRLLPKRMRRHHAHRRAVIEYLQLTHRLKADEDAILFFVAKAERYAHIFATHRLHDRIGNAKLTAIIADFTAAAKHGSLDDACLAAIRRIEGILVQMAV